MNTHRMGLAKLCFDWQGKTTHIIWEEGNDPFYLFPLLLVLSKGEENPILSPTGGDCACLSSPPSLSLWQLGHSPPWFFSKTQKGQDTPVSWEQVN